MRVLVTGGAGFIGSAVVRHLVGQGHDVLNVDKLTYAGNLMSLASVEGSANYRFLKADIVDQPAMQKAFDSFQPDWVMHLAAETHVDRSINNADAFIRTNILGTHVLLEVSRQYWDLLGVKKKASFRFLHVSTDEVYGSLGNEGLFKETTAYDPSSPYSASKAAADHLVKAWHRTYGLPVVVSNCSNNYGPYHFPEKLVPLNIINAIQKKPMPVYGNGSNIRDWLHVEDHARALALIVGRGRIGETYNVGGHNEYTNLEVLRLICHLMNEIRPTGDSYEALIEFVVDRPGNDQRYAIDAGKLEAELGWRACETFNSGLRKTVIWYLENEAWWRPLRENVYKGERLGFAGTSACG